MLELLRKEIRKLIEMISKEEFATNPELYHRLRRILRMLRKKS